MVNIRQHDVSAPILDAEAEEQFAKDWATYQKIVDHDYAGHREVYGILHRILAHETVAVLDDRIVGRDCAV